MNNKDTKYLLIIIITLIITVINIMLFINIIIEPNKIIKQEENLKTDNNTISEEPSKVEFKSDEEQDKSDIKKLKNMGERSRMEFYFGKFITAIEEENYEKAYSYLNENFRNNYFKTVDEFKEYINKQYPDMIGINYDNIERQGDIYVLFIKVFDVLKPSDSFDLNVVLKESEYNNFEMSFQVL